jgi:hypothetical protein
MVTLISVGCTPWTLARRTLFTELHEYPRVTDGRLSSRQYTRWAKAEWREYASQHPDVSHSSDYVSGFMHGFTCQVRAGGTTDPPPVPPRRYWRVGYRNDRGDQAIQDWYAGYRHGAQTARDNGYRDRATVPSSLLYGYNQIQTPNWELSTEQPTVTPNDAATTLGDPFVDEPISPTEEPMDRPKQLPEPITPAVPTPAKPSDNVVPEPRPPESPLPDDIFNEVPDVQPSTDPTQIEEAQTEANHTDASRADVQRTGAARADVQRTNSARTNTAQTAETPTDAAPAEPVHAAPSVAPLVFEIEKHPPLPPWVTTRNSLASSTLLIEKIVPADSPFRESSEESTTTERQIGVSSEPWPKPVTHELPVPADHQSGLPRFVESSAELAAQPRSRLVDVPAETAGDWQPRR